MAALPVHAHAHSKAADVHMLQRARQRPAARARPPAPRPLAPPTAGRSLQQAGKVRVHEAGCQRARLQQAVLAAALQGDQQPPPAGRAAGDPAVVRAARNHLHVDGVRQVGVRWRRPPRPCRPPNWSLLARRELLKHKASTPLILLFSTGCPAQGEGEPLTTTPGFAHRTSAADVGQRSSAARLSSP